MPTESRRGDIKLYFWTSNCGKGYGLAYMNEDAFVAFKNTKKMCGGMVKLG